MWTIKSTDTNEPRETMLSENEVRGILKVDTEGLWFAENDSGDVISKYDGPITVGRTEGRF